MRRLEELAGRAGTAVSRAFMVMESLPPGKQREAERLVRILMAEGVVLKLRLLSGKLTDSHVDLFEKHVVELEKLLEEAGIRGEGE